MPDNKAIKTKLALKRTLVLIFIFKLLNIIFPITLSTWTTHFRRPYYVKALAWLPRRKNSAASFSGISASASSPRLPNRRLLEWNIQDKNFYP